MALLQELRRFNGLGVPRVYQALLAIGALWVPWVAFFGPHCVPGYATRADVVMIVAIAFGSAGLLARAALRDDEASRFIGVVGAASLTSLLTAVAPSFPIAVGLALAGALRPPKEAKALRNALLAAAAVVILVRVALALAMLGVPADLLHCQGVIRND